MSLLRNTKAKAALALVNPVNAVLPVDAETRISALEAVDHWHTNLTQLDKVRGYGSFTFFSDGTGVSIATKTASYTLATTDSVVLCNASTGSMNITLPSPSSCYDSTNLASIVFEVYKVDSSVNTITILPSSSETIAGESKIVLKRYNEHVELITDGTNWFIKNRDRIHEGAKQTYKVSSVIVSDTTVANTTTETTLFTTSFDSDELRAGDNVEINMNGIYSTANASDTFTVRVKINSTTVHSFTSVAKNVTNTPVEMTHRFTVRSSGATASITGRADFAAYNDGLFASDVADGTIDTTSTNTITVTMQWDTADVSNSGTIKQGICKING